MAWGDLPPALREIIERPGVLTRRELEVVTEIAELKAGQGLGTVARRLGVSKGTVQRLFERASRKIAHEFALQRGYGNGG